MGCVLLLLGVLPLLRVLLLQLSVHSVVRCLMLVLMRAKVAHMSKDPLSRLVFVSAFAVCYLYAGWLVRDGAACLFDE